jgi:hypothetical protein
VSDDKRTSGKNVRKLGDYKNGPVVGSGRALIFSNKQTNKLDPSTNKPTPRRGVGEISRKRAAKRRAKFAQVYATPSASSKYANARKGPLSRLLTSGAHAGIDFKRLGAEYFVDYVAGSDEHRDANEILDLAANKKVRRDLVARLAQEFLRMFVTYRRAKEVADGKAPRFKSQTSDQSLQRAKVVMIHCVQNDIHPVTYLEYWDAEIHAFTGRLRVPVLHVIGGESALDRAVCDGLGGKAPGASKKRTAVGSGSATAPLDPRFRDTMNAAGFDTRSITDDRLRDIQNQGRMTASARRTGIALWCPPGERGRMIRWVADNWFSEAAK